MSPFFASVRQLRRRRKWRMALCWLLLTLFACMAAQVAPIAEGCSLVHAASMPMSHAVAQHEHAHEHGACHGLGICAGSLPTVVAALSVAWLAPMAAASALLVAPIPHPLPQLLLRPPAV